MPRDLFSQTLVTEPRRRGSRWTVAGSFAAHAVLVALLVVVPIVSGASTPEINERIRDFILTTIPKVPEIRIEPAAPVPALNPAAAPLEAPNTVKDPPPSTMTATGPVPPGALVVSDPGALVRVGTNSESTRTLAPPPPPPVAKPREPVRPGGAIKVPQRVAYAPPVYPQIAQVAKVEGTVILEATIDETGNVKDVRVLRSIPLLDAAAIEAVNKWRYTPTLLNGAPVPILMTVTVTFQLR